MPTRPWCGSSTERCSVVHIDLDSVCVGVGCDIDAAGGLGINGQRLRVAIADAVLAIAGGSARGGVAPSRAQGRVLVEPVLHDVLTAAGSLHDADATGVAVGRQQAHVVGGLVRATHGYGVAAADGRRAGRHAARAAEDQIGPRADHTSSAQFGLDVEGESGEPITRLRAAVGAGEVAESGRAKARSVGARYRAGLVAGNVTVVGDGAG